MASSGVMSTTMVPGSSAASMASKRWYFPEEQLKNTPSVRTGQITLEKELSYRQQAANFIQDMGQRLEVTQLCINTAIVYMQRFYMFHSFTRFHRNSIASAALFLAAKVEEQPRKLEHVIKIAHMCLHRGQPPLDTRSEAYQEQAQELVTNENILLQTLGFDVAIDHPHTHVVKCCQLVKAAKELAQTSYFMATNSLHLTTMCLRYSPTTVACVCIHLACKWSNYKIPLSAQKKEWFTYIDQEVTIELLEKLTEEFLAIFDKCPESRLRKKKIMNSKQGAKELEGYMPQSTSSSGSSGSHRSSSSGKHHHHQHHHHNHHGHHHRSSSSSSSMAKQQQAHANKHMNPAMFDPSMRSSHREKSHSSSSKSQSMVQQPVPQQQPPMASTQQFANPHMDYNRGQHMHNSSQSSSQSRSTQQQMVQMQHQQQRHQQQLMQQQQQQQQRQQAGQWPQQDSRRSLDPNMSLNYMQNQKSRSSSSQQHRHSMPTAGMPDQRYLQQQQHKMKHQQQHPPPLPPLPPSDPPLPPKPQPPPPPLPQVQAKPTKSIFDIDSPEPVVKMPPAPSITSSTLSAPKMEPKFDELGDIFDHAPESTTPPRRSRQDSASSTKSREISPSVVKLNKMDMSGFEKTPEGRYSLKPPKEEPGQPQMSLPVSIPFSTTPSSGHSEAASSSSAPHKKHKKEKKSKKDKKEKRDKSEKYAVNGDYVKKHKHKHKERDREAAAAAPAAIPKLKIKMGGDSSVPPVKISLGGKEDPNAANRKRHRQASNSSDSSLGSSGTSLAPAQKMSRVLGTTAEQESSFLTSQYHHFSKNSRKVPTK